MENKEGIESLETEDLSLDNNIKKATTLSTKLLISIIIISHIIVLLIGILISYFIFSNKKEYIFPPRYQDGPLYDIVETPSFQKHTHTLIYIHGLDNSPLKNAENMTTPLFPLVPNDTKVVLICAPYTYISRSKISGTSWFDIKAGPFELTPEYYSYTDVVINSKRIIELIDKEANELNGDYSKIFLYGYSQGACMSYYIAFNLGVGKELGGVASMSGVMFPEIFDEDTYNDNTKTHFLIGHGKEDEIFNIELHKKTIKKFDDYPNFERHYYDGIKHFIFDASKQDLQNFFHKYMKNESN